MGPITLAEAAGQNVTITVDFDRPVTASSFVKQDVQVFFHSTSDTSNFVQLTVTGVAPIGGTNTGPDPNAYTEFTVFFDPLPNGANPATYNYTGTYSYLIAPDNGAGLAISSPVESFVGKTLRTSDPMDQNADGTPDENPLTMPNGFVGSTPGDVYAVPAPAPTITSTTFEGFIQTGSPVVEVFSSLTGLGVGDVVTGDGIPSGTTIMAVDDFDFTITLSANATTNAFEDLVSTSEALFKFAAYTGGPNLGGYILSPPFNQQTLPIIVPGPQVVATSVPGGDAAAGNLITGGTAEHDRRDVRPADAGEHLHGRPGEPDHGPDRPDLGSARLRVDQHHRHGHHRRHELDRPLHDHLDDNRPELRRHVQDRRTSPCPSPPHSRRIRP